jgi:hypothetical protein
MGYLDDMLAAGRIYRDPEDFANKVQHAFKPPPPDYMAQLQASGQGPPAANATQALTAQAKQAQAAYAAPVAEPEAVPAGSITADRAVNPIDRYITDSDTVRRLGPEGQRLVTGVTDFVTSPMRAAYDAPGAFQRGDYLSGALNTAEAVPAVGKVAGAVKGSAALAGAAAKGAGLTSAMFVPVGFAEKMNYKNMLRKGASQADIWHDTLTGMLPEGKLAKEIDDRGLQVGAAATSTGGLIPHPAGGGWQGDIQHPELFQREPWLTNADLKLVAGPSNEGGAYWPGSSPPSIDLNVNAGPNLGGPDRIVAHELQHPIQNKYGWSPGSNPQATQTPGMQRYNQFLARTGNLSAQEQAAIAQHPGQLPYYGASGEDLARNVQNRLDMDIQTRRDTPPWISSDLNVTTRAFPSGMPRLLYGGDRMPLRSSKFNDELAQLWNIYGYGKTWGNTP